jgi:hypothetical protein
MRVTHGILLTDSAVHTTDARFLEQGYFVSEESRQRLWPKMPESEPAVEPSR